MVVLVAPTFRFGTADVFCGVAGQANGGMIIRSHRFQGLVPGPAGVIPALMPKSPIFPGSGGREF